MTELVTAQFSLNTTPDYDIWLKSWRELDTTEQRKKLIKRRQEPGRLLIVAANRSTEELDMFTLVCMIRAFCPSDSPNRYLLGHDCQPISYISLCLLVDRHYVGINHALLVAAREGWWALIDKLLNKGAVAVTIAKSLVRMRNKPPISSLEQATTHDLTQQFRALQDEVTDQVNNKLQYNINQHITREITAGREEFAVWLGVAAML